MARTDIRVLECQAFFTGERCRTPLKFGAVVIEEITLCHVRALVEDRAGARAEGWGATFLSDLWAFPSKSVSHADKDAAFREITRRYCRLVEGHGRHAHPVDVALDLKDDLRRAARDVSREMRLSEEVPFLGALVCGSPADAAMHDAFGNAAGICSYDGYGPAHMGWDLSRLMGPQMKGRWIADFVSPSYAPRVPAFHLVGGLDKLTRAEINDSDPEDGLPNCLEDWVARDGLRCLKVKLLGADLAWDLKRTEDVVRVARRARKAAGLDENDLALSMDTNEQCASPDYVVEFLDRLKDEDAFAHAKLLYVEQPTERDLSAHRHDMRAVASRKPVLVDEGLTSIEDMSLARELGWSGIALKTCKMHSFQLLYVARAESWGMPYTVQDLSNPGIALLQSVGLAARLRPLMGVETNSCQYFPSANVPEEKVHPGLCRRRDGCVATDTIGTTGLGLRWQEIGRVLTDNDQIRNPNDESMTKPE